MGRACSAHKGKFNACRFLVVKREGKRPLGRTRRMCVDNIKMNLSPIASYLNALTGCFHATTDRHLMRLG
jgi:hypothetical protein